ncbi:MAG TPA: sulfotransferase [Gemmatimonadota bacterium]
MTAGSPAAGGGPTAPAVHFVLGTGRCGSTLVHEVLSRHPDVGFVSNLDDKLPFPELLGRWNGPLYRFLPPSFAQKGRVRFAPSEAYGILDRRVSPILSTPARDLHAADASPWVQRRLRRFFEDRARAQRSPVFLHKFTGWPRAGFLARVFPDARFVNVIRDGRAVASSWLQMPWWLGYGGPERWQWGPLPRPYAAEWESSGRSFVTLAAIAWKMLMDAYEESRAELPGGQWLDVRYEDFLANPREELGRTLAFLGLAWTDPFERGFRRHVLDPGRRAAYLRDLDPAQVSELERSLADHLVRYGYEAAPAAPRERSEASPAPAAASPGV